MYRLTNNGITIPRVLGSLYISDCFLFSFQEERRSPCGPTVPWGARMGAYVWATMSVCAQLDIKGLCAKMVGKITLSKVSAIAVTVHICYRLSDCSENSTCTCIFKGDVSLI